jgi:hypothetical protein
VRVAVLVLVAALAACGAAPTAPECQWPADFKPLLSSQGDTLGWFCVRASSGVHVAAHSVTLGDAGGSGAVFVDHVLREHLAA